MLSVLSGHGYRLIGESAMSTTYRLIERNGEGLEATESSSLISLDVLSDLPDYGTRYIFNDSDLLKMSLETLKVASYIAEEPEEIVARFMSLLQSDPYLGSMLDTWTTDLKDTARREAYDKLRAER